MQKVAQQFSLFNAEETTQPSQINEQHQQTQEIYPADKFKIYVNEKFSDTEIRKSI